jgi:pyruvate dehydrogenase (quinone)
LLIPKLAARPEQSFLERAQHGYKKWSELMETRGTATDAPMKPQVVAHELGKRLPWNAIVTSDSGTNTTWWARHIPSRRGQMHSCSGNLATMACGFPYALAAQIAHPDRPVVAFVGDGGFTMLMGELATCVKYQLPVKIFIVKNNSLGQIKWEQMVFLGNPEYGCDLQPIDFATVARGFGVTSFTIQSASECGDIVQRALDTPGPVLIEALVDPNEPPMPAKVTVTQAIHFAESLAKGTKDWQKIAATIASNKVRELV